MRRLTVKNFSVIREADLDFGRITVLIGPQSSGKSLLCKLAFFFGQVVPEIAYSTLMLRMPFRQFNETVQSQFVDRFPAVAWSGQEFRISYASNGHRFTVEGRKSADYPVFDFGGFPQEYSQWIDSHLEEGSARPAISAIKSGGRIPDFPVQIEGSQYIPTGRAFFSTPNKGFASFAGKNLDWITQRFSTEMDFNYRALTEPSNGDNGLRASFGKEASGILGGRVVLLDGIPHFQSSTDERKLPFQLLSSGTLELLPLLNPLSKLASDAKPSDSETLLDLPYGPIFVEEPESSVFPKTQYDLIRLFAWLSNEPALSVPFAITTHSPYVLSAFNNLIEAAQVVTVKPELKDEIVKLVPEQYWIKSSDFRAYCIHDGILESIMDSETGLISANYLDSISETIGVEFDELLRLGYVES
jgi:hypothetical protein